MARAGPRLRARRVEGIAPAVVEVAAMPLPYALNAYGLPHTMGFLATRDGVKVAEPLSVFGLMDAAVELDLAGVDTPLPKGMEAAEVRDALLARGLRLVVETGCLVDLTADEVRTEIDRAADAGAKVVRVVLSSVLCGERGKLAGGWQARLDALVARLLEVLPRAEERGVSLSLENHQDATAADFEELYDRSGHSPAFGVTLDTGNPLAVAEEPVATARRLAPLIRHLHLKDYTMHFAPEGYRLVRCPNGVGVIDFPAILEAVRGNGFDDLLPGIEIAAQATRTIPMLEPRWWESFPPRPIDGLLGALGHLWRAGRPVDEPYSSAWERGERSEAVVAEEWAVVRESVAYFRALPPPDGWGEER